MKIEKIQQRIKLCDTCKVGVLPNDWHVFCTKHFTREHIECNYSRLAKSKHYNCKIIHRNKPEHIK